MTFNALCCSAKKHFWNNLIFWYKKQYEMTHSRKLQDDSFSSFKVRTHLLHICLLYFHQQLVLVWSNFVVLTFVAAWCLKLLINTLIIYKFQTYCGFLLKIDNKKQQLQQWQAQGAGGRWGLENKIQVVKYRLGDRLSCWRVNLVITFIYRTLLIK